MHFIYIYINYFVLNSYLYDLFTDINGHGYLC